MEKKTFEERVYETQELIKDVIGASDLNIAVIELIMRNLYLEVQQLAEKNLRERIQNRINEENDDDTGI